MTPLAQLIADMQVPQGSLALMWLGGAGFILKGPGGPLVVIDPYLSDSVARSSGWQRLPISPIPMGPADLRADVALVTHAHDDHLDPETMPELLAASDAVVAGPTSCVEMLREWGIAGERVALMDAGAEQELRGARVRAAPAFHESPLGGQTPDAVGFLIEIGGLRVYHTGDTLAHPTLAQVRSQRPDVLLVCINGGYGNMGPDEAAQLTAEIGPAVVVPMHWGMFAENTVDPREFVRALAATGSPTRPLVMAPGDVCVSAFARIGA